MDTTNAVPTAPSSESDRARFQRITAKLLKPGLTDDERRRILLQLRPQPVYLRPEPPPSPAAPKRRAGKYWSEPAFMEIWRSHREEPTHDKANRICEKHFMPLAAGWCASKAAKGNHEAIGIDEAVQVATIVCLAKLDQFDPARGTGFNFFSKVCQNAIRIENNRELKHRERFVCESDLVESQEDDD